MTITITTIIIITINLSFFSSSSISHQPMQPFSCSSKKMQKISISVGRRLKIRDLRVKDKVGRVITVKANVNNNNNKKTLKNSNNSMISLKL